MVDDQAAELAKYKSLDNSIQAEADLELVSAMLGKERTKIGEADARREARVKTTLKGSEEVARERRQRLNDDLERKDAELYKAQREIRELGRKLLTSNQAAAAALAASSSPKPTQSSPSPLPKTSPGSSQSSSPTSTAPTVGAQSWFQVQRSRIGIPKSLSPGRLLIFLFIFLLIPDFKNKSLSRQTTEEIVTWRAANEVSRQEVVEMEEQFQRSRRVARSWVYGSRPTQRKHGDGRERSGGVMIGDLKGLAFEYKENGRTLILGGGFSIEIFLKIEKKRVWNFLRVEFFAG